MNKVGRTATAIAVMSLMLVPLSLAQPAARPHAPAAKSPMDGVIHVLFGGKTFEQTVIAPDGKQLAWVENSKEGSAIYVSSVSGGTPRRITAGGKAEESVAWSPDSKQIAFFLTPQSRGSRSFMSLAPWAGRPASLPA